MSASGLSPGGRGQDGSPVITFPDYPAFSEIPDKEFQNVMTYLTSIPRCVRSEPSRHCGSGQSLRFHHRGVPTTMG